MIRKIWCIFIVIIVIGVCGCSITIKKVSKSETNNSENTSKVVSTEKGIFVFVYRKCNKVNEMLTLKPENAIIIFQEKGGLCHVCNGFCSGRS